MPAIQLQTKQQQSTQFIANNYVLVIVNALIAELIPSTPFYVASVTIYLVQIKWKIK